MTQNTDQATGSLTLRLLALDVDGVLTDGTIYYSQDGEAFKGFHAHDGLALSLLRRAGVQVAVITGRGGPILDRRLDDLGVQHRIYHCIEKAAALKELASSLQIDLADAAFMGDDLIDLGAMAVAGFSAAPANAVADVRAAADLVTKAAGGAGAVRECVEHLLARNRMSLQGLLHELNDQNSVVSPTRTHDVNVEVRQ